MTTRNYVPNDHNEGEIGVENKWWAKAHIVNVKATNAEAESVNATTVKAESVNATTVKAESVNATTVKAESVNATTVKAESVNVNGSEIISNYVKRNQSYVLGDIVYQNELSSWVRLECVEAGTTASTVPDEYKSLQIGEYITDGSTKWIACDIRDGLSLGDIAYRPILKEGYVKLNGATVQRADYPRLVKYATDNNLWTSSPTTEVWKFGTGDGSATFVLPDYRSRFIEGGDTPSKIEAGIPNITGGFRGIYASGIADSTYFGAFSSGQAGGLSIQSLQPPSLIDCQVNFNAQLVSQVYGRSNTVQPPSIMLIPQIKY